MSVHIDVTIALVVDVNNLPEGWVKMTSETKDRWVEAQFITPLYLADAYSKMWTTWSEDYER